MKKFNFLNLRLKSKVFGLFLGLSISLLLTLFARENPLHILQILINASIGSLFDLGTTLSYAAPLMLTGLSVAIAFHAGLFNVGAEGQLTMGALGATLVGVYLPHVPPVLAPILAMIGALLFGGIWAGLVGVLKATRGVHEVICTIMLNFVATGAASWFIVHLIPSQSTQNPESLPIGENYFLRDYDLTARLFADTPANNGLWFGIVLCLGMWFLLWKTKFGFQLRACGLNISAAERNGIDVKRTQIGAMILAGMLASVVAYCEVLGTQGKLRLGFSPEYGFLGIAVSILAANNPLGIIFSAILLAALHKGASDLDIETATITRDFSKIVQALIILACSAQYLFLKSNAKKKAVDVIHP